MVLFCGGAGLRLRGYVLDYVPKPMVQIGNRPILWHLMKYYDILVTKTSFYVLVTKVT